MPNKKIRVDASIEVAHDPNFEFSHEEDHGEFGAGQCAERHPIRYGYIFVNSITGDQVELGGDCQWKVYLFRKWQNLEPQEITPMLIKIGEKFWNIDKDGYWIEIKEILAKSNMTIDFDKLPAKEEQERYLKFVRELLASAIALRQTREKEATKRRVEQAKLKYLKDPDFIALKNASFTDSFNNETKHSLLNWFERKRDWTPKQRSLVNLLIERTKKPQPQQVDKNLDIALAIVKKISEIETGNAKNFTGDVLKYKTIQRKALSPKQKSWLIALYKKHLNASFDFESYLNS